MKVRKNKLYNYNIQVGEPKMDWEALAHMS